MGGGGTGGYRNVGDVSKLLQEAKDRLKEGGRKNIFISFDFDDANEVNLLRGQAINDNSEIEFNDWSVKDAFNSDNSDYIKRQITERIRQSSITVVYISENTKGSRWVNWEIKKSLDLGKKVIAVHSGNIPPSQPPSGVTQNGIKVIPWSKLKDEI